VDCPYSGVAGRVVGSRSASLCNLFGGWASVADPTSALMSRRDEECPPRRAAAPVGMTGEHSSKSRGAPAGCERRTRRETSAQRGAETSSLPDAYIMFRYWPGI